jgi:hypothetical protein
MLNAASTVPTAHTAITGHTGAKITVIHGSTPAAAVSITPEIEKVLFRFIKTLLSALALPPDGKALFFLL